MMYIYLVFLGLISSAKTLDCVKCYKYDLSNINIPEQLIEKQIGFPEQGEAMYD